MLKLNESLSTAYDLQEDLRQFWNQRSKPAAEKYLDQWCRRAEAFGIRQMQVIPKTPRGHRTGLWNWYDHPLSTGPRNASTTKPGRCNDEPTDTATTNS